MDDRLKKIEQIFSIVQESITKDEFVKAFDLVLRVVKDAKTALETKNAKEIENIKAVNFEIQKKSTEVSETAKQEMMDYCMVEMEKMIKDWKVMQKKHDAKMQAIDKKMGEVVDGKDADEEKVKSKVLEILTPKIPKIEDIEKDLPKLGEPIRDSLELLRGDERLDKSAIKGLDEELKRIEQVKTTVIRGGGRASHAMKIKALTADGVTKTFSVPKSVTSYLMGSDFPTIYYENSGFTINATRTSITITSDNAPSSGSQLLYVYSEMFNT